MNSNLTTITVGTAGRVRARLDGCPSCLRPIALDNVCVDVDGDQYLDMAAVETAQRLHVRACTGR